MKFKPSLDWNLGLRRPNKQQLSLLPSVKHKRGNPPHVPQPVWRWRAALPICWELVTEKATPYCFYLHSNPAVWSNYREYGQALSNEHEVSGESINSSKITSTVTQEEQLEPINERSCKWKPLHQTTFSLAISHYLSQRSAAWCVLEADFKHPWKKPRAGSRISAKWTLQRGSSPDHPEAPTSEFQELMLSPPRQDTALRPRVQQNASWWSTISWPSLGSQI